MSEIINLLNAFVSNPTLLGCVVLLAVICIGVPQAVQYLTLRSLIKDLKESIDRVNERLDKFVDFILTNLKIKPPSDDK